MTYWVKTHFTNRQISQSFKPSFYSFSFNFKFLSYSNIFFDIRFIHYRKKYIRYIAFVSRKRKFLGHFSIENEKFVQLLMYFGTTVRLNLLTNNIHLTVNHIIVLLRTFKIFTHFTTNAIIQWVLIFIFAIHIV